MKYLLYFFILLVFSCQTKRSNQTYTGGLTDSLPISNIAAPKQQDTSVVITKNTKDTIFLGFRIGMTSSEFEKHKQVLVKNKKLKSAGNSLTYQIKVDENELLSDLASKGDDIPEKIWTGSGTVVPEFFNGKLISITLKFINTNGDNAYLFFLTNLYKKYSHEAILPLVYFDNDKKIDTLQVGNSVSCFITKNWSVGDINISLRFDREVFKIAHDKTKNSDDVVLKYWSEYYYTLKQDDEGKERNKVQADL